MMTITHPTFMHDGEHKASIKIEDLALLEGHLPPRVVGLVAEWAAGHKDELLADWERARKREPLLPIEPLR